MGRALLTHRPMTVTQVRIEFLFDKNEKVSRPCDYCKTLWLTICWLSRGFSRHEPHPGPPHKGKGEDYAFYSLWAVACIFPRAQE